MSPKKVLVLAVTSGGSLRLAVHHELHGDVDVTVVSASDRFLFNPSLIWLPFGTRSRADITFPFGSHVRHPQRRVRPRATYPAQPRRACGRHHRRPLPSAPTRWVRTTLEDCEGTTAGAAPGQERAPLSDRHLRRSSRERNRHNRRFDTGAG